MSDRHVTIGVFRDSQITRSHDTVVAVASYADVVDCFGADGLNSRFGGHVVLMGGEHADLEVSRFPSIGKLALFDSGAGTVKLYDEESAETKSVMEWMAKK